MNLKLSRTIFAFAAISLTLIAITISTQAMTSEPINPITEMFKKDYPKDKERPPAQARGDAIREFMMECCEDQGVATKSLKDEGFAVEIIDEPKRIASLNEHYAFSQKMTKKRYPDYEIVEFDTLIIATKSASILGPLPYGPGEYTVVLRGVNGKIHWVTARIERSAF